MSSYRKILNQFISDNNLNGEFKETMDMAQLNIDEQFDVRRSEEILGICRYLQNNNLVATFFNEE